MSSDSAMLSDDDRPLVPSSALTSSSSHVATKENGHANGDAEDHSMSEDDMPLVRTNLHLRS